MTEPENLDPGNMDDFNEGFEAAYDIASQETQEQMETMMEDAGFSDEDIEEALYDPAPRRGGRRKHRRSSRRSSRRSYDPVPKRRRGRRSGRRAGAKKGRKGKKSKLAKFRKFAMPAAAAGSFYFSYAANAKARGLTFVDALKFDLANWSADKTMAKISADPIPVVGTIGIPFVRGYIPGANSGMVGLAVDVIHGILAGQALTQVIDEPAPVRSSTRQTVTVTAGNAQPMPAMQDAQPAYHNPYGGY